MDAASSLEQPKVGLTGPSHHNGRVRASELTAAHLELADWLLTQEIDRPGDLPAITVAAEQILKKLLRRLAKLITPIGCQALLSRALHLARVDHPFLEGLQVGVTDDSRLVGLAATVANLDTDEARAGLTALLGTLIGLVVVFIGEDLTMRLLVDLWSGLPAPARSAH